MRFFKYLFPFAIAAGLALVSCDKDPQEGSGIHTKPVDGDETVTPSTQEKSGFTMSTGYWAPAVRKVNANGVEKLRMYYCLVPSNCIKTGSLDFDGSWTERAIIGMCESSDPAGGRWEDKGYVVCSSSDKGRDGYARSSESDWNAYFYYNAIDPTYIVNPAGDGKDYLIYGSWHSGFALLEIDHVTGKPVNAPGDPWAGSAAELSSRFGVRIGTRNSNSRWQGSEAPEIIYKDGYYYLFMAYDGLDVPYNTRVVRSTSIEGPYKDITGRNFTNGRGDCFPIVTHPYKFSKGYGWVGISHCAVFPEEGGSEWFYMSQGRFPVNVGGNAYSNALMMGHVRRLAWVPASPDTPDDLWPVALPERYGAVPQSPVSKEEIAGTWEHINLGYHYAAQDASEDLLLLPDGTMSGALNGKWSYDAGTGLLTLDDNATAAPVCVKVTRELDWEASPRVPTLVYAGTGVSLNATWWGKKVAEADGSAIAATPGYTAPSYNDNYVSLAAWSHHDSWNLANTHDPSVAYFDGYYYEWGTDASYGNAHLDAASGRHFPGKRSRNLVDWEYVPGPFNATPQWAADTLNSIRKRMGLKSIAKD